MKSRLYFHAMGYPVSALFLFVLSIVEPFSFQRETGSDRYGNLIGTDTPQVTLIILGTLQDGGSPHPGCKKDCCRELFLNPDPTRKVVSLGIIDHVHQKTYLIEATPDFPEQIQLLLQEAEHQASVVPDCIFLTHAHIGHYTGLMYLGREALNAKDVPVYAMPRMKHFLEGNGPWSQLVTAGNIALKELQADMEVQLTPSLRITPFTVPHRDEYSETVGFRIDGPNKSVLFIPDIDKWQKWDRSIIEEIGKVDYAFVDGTFYDAAEINYRSISTIPHPFISESMAMFDTLPGAEKQKIYFIHFNHTNPVLDLESARAKEVIAAGYRIAMMGQVIGL